MFETHLRRLVVTGQYFMLEAIPLHVFSHKLSNASSYISRPSLAECVPAT